VAALAAIALASRGSIFIVAAAAALWPLLAYALWLAARGAAARALSHVAVLGWVLAISFAAWILPVIALWITLRQLGAPSELEIAAHAFATGTLLGGLVGLPLGAGVAGSTAIVALTGHAIAEDTASIAIATVRAGTAWFALALGVLAFLRWRREIVALMRPPADIQHFDRIASEYDEQIPRHVRDRLLERKIAIMQRRLEECGIGAGAAGLDVGCGQGWYAIEMARKGYRMSAFDQSAGQVELARRHAAEQAVAVDFTAIDAAAMPFADQSFDFAYSINVIHHIVDLETRQRALAEIIRVLRPGGVFFLHEINVENPLFRTYMGYVFPFLRSIDDGTERWIKPSLLPQVQGAAWRAEVDYFTFMPDFMPPALLRAMAGMERWLERSPLRRWSAHYTARLVKSG
jgi:2-polyprenyl-3-methyl-5-hydroxy-6-metoxy-1,4-benzoquinol methylase